MRSLAIGVAIGMGLWSCALAERVLAAESVAELNEALPEAVRGVLEARCLGCHSGAEGSGGVDLSLERTTGDVYRHARTWNKVSRVVRGREMPPATEEPPSEEERRLLAEWVEATLKRTARAAPADPGHVTVRRLNRVEYQNTVRDLLGLQIDVARDLPSDPAGNGFDNQGDTLFIPPVLLEKYLDSTKRILVEAFRTESPQRQMLLAYQPASEPSAADGLSAAEAAERNLAVLLPRVFRRPVTEEEVAARVKLVSEALERGETFEAGMQAAVASALLSPHFLFRVESNQRPDGSTDVYPLTDHELATRLSYFLWSTMPDAELTALADAGQLHEAEALRGQVSRMLADAKSVALAENFTAQWFGYRDMRTHEMDARRFGAFNGVREDMYAESRRFFDTLFRENGRLLDVLDCDYVFVNARLAAHYGLPEVAGDELRKVAAPDRRRGGVLGMGSTLTVTSYPTRTSPVLRGKWVLETLLGTPPPPPPPNVKALPQSDEVKDGLTLRQRFEKHRSQASCASCHVKMDPLGFGLENFDGIGAWREQDNGVAIDASAQLPDGTDVEGVAGLKDALLARQELFLRQFVEKTLTYALGRAVDYYDEATVRDTLARLAADQYRAQTLILAVVESHAFRHKRNSE